MPDSVQGYYSLPSARYLNIMPIKAIQGHTPYGSIIAGKSTQDIGLDKL
jgi:hypothetical protein